MTISVQHGTLDVPADLDVTVEGSGTSTIELIGPATDVNAALLTYTPDAGYAGVDTVTVSAAALSTASSSGGSGGSSSGTGGWGTVASPTTTTTLSLNVLSPVAPPTITAPRQSRCRRSGTCRLPRSRRRRSCRHPSRPHHLAVVSPTPITPAAPIAVPVTQTVGPMLAGFTKSVGGAPRGGGRRCRTRRGSGPDFGHSFQQSSGLGAVTVRPWSGRNRRRTRVPGQSRWAMAPRAQARGTSSREISPPNRSMPNLWQPHGEPVPGDRDDPLVLGGDGVLVSATDEVLAGAGLETALETGLAAAPPLIRGTLLGQVAMSFDVFDPR